MNVNQVIVEDIRYRARQRKSELSVLHAEVNSAQQRWADLKRRYEVAQRELEFVAAFLQEHDEAHRADPTFWFCSLGVQEPAPPAQARVVKVDDDTDRVGL